MAAQTTNAKIATGAGGNRRPRVVILGAGFAGLTAAFELKSAPVDVTIIDRTNHHLFQPMLYQVATAALSPSDISAATRHIVHKHKNTEVVMGDVKAVDVERRIVTVDTIECEGQEFPYDYLLIGLGTRHSYFGNDRWEPHAPGLKTLGDATEIRRRFLLAFEKAEQANDATERDAFMTFVVVGAGPTGCELAGVMPEIARKAMRNDFRRIDTDRTKVILLEAGRRILPAFPDDLAAKAKTDLEHLGVEVRIGAKVTEIDEAGVTLDGGEFIPARTVIWAAGNAASPVAKTLGVPLDRAGRVIVNPDLSVPGHPEIFVAGDLAAAKQPDGTSVPGVAQGGIQGGRQAARNILSLLYREQTRPFVYWNKGDMAVIGRNRAIANLHLGKREIHVHGFLAWLMWLFIHILYLIGFRNKLSVLLQWAYAYVTYQRGARLIEETEQRELGQTAQSPGGAVVGPWQT
jgi:NADH dehydrogenase